MAAADHDDAEAEAEAQRAEHLRLTTCGPARHERVLFREARCVYLGGHQKRDFAYGVWPRALTLPTKGVRVGTRHFLPPPAHWDTHIGPMMRDPRCRVNIVDHFARVGARIKCKCLLCRSPSRAFNEWLDGVNAQGESACYLCGARHFLPDAAPDVAAYFMCDACYGHATTHGVCRVCYGRTEAWPNERPAYVPAAAAAAADDDNDDTESVLECRGRHDWH